MKYWHIRGNKDDLRRSLVFMLILYVTCFNLPWIVPMLVTKLPTAFFMFTGDPLIYLDKWLALGTNFSRDLILDTCSLTIWAHEHSFKYLTLTLGISRNLTLSLRKRLGPVLGGLTLAFSAESASKNGVNRWRLILVCRWCVQMKKYNI